MSNNQAGWWTPEVVDQVRTMRRTQTFTTEEQRKLAAHLDAAGCPEPAHAERLRSGLPPLQAARELCLLLDGEYAEAVHFLEHVAATIEEERIEREVDEWDYETKKYVRDKDAEARERANPEYTLEWLVGVLRDSVTSEGEDYHTFSFDTPDVLYEHGNAERIWNSYEKLTGKPVPSKARKTKYGATLPFSCSC